MTWLVLGATGLLGQAFTRTLSARGERVIGLARSGSDVSLDITDPKALTNFLVQTKPDVVVNCAAMASVNDCENDPTAAYAVNTRPLATLADWSLRANKLLVHISTDHYFPDGGPVAHTEDDPVQLVNEYARTKYAAEALALTSPRALVLRTNIAGARKGFGRWLIDRLQARDPITAFIDTYCSTIWVGDFADATIDLVRAGASGCLNLSASEVFSKAEFIQETAFALGIQPDWITIGSSATLVPRRPRSIGLDVSRAESLLGRALPGLQETTRALAREYKECLTTPPLTSANDASPSTSPPTSSPTSPPPMTVSFRAPKT